METVNKIKPSISQGDSFVYCGHLCNVDLIGGHWHALIWSNEGDVWAHVENAGSFLDALGVCFRLAPLSRMEAWEAAQFYEVE